MRTELRLFGVLFEGRGEILECGRLIERTWPNTNGREGAHALGVYVDLLRHRLSAIGAASALETVRDIGYRLTR